MEQMNDRRTLLFNIEKEKRDKAKEIIKTVYESLEEKGYNPYDQLVGYILSGDPSYITSYNNARNIIKHVERDELVEELLRAFIELK